MAFSGKTKKSELGILSVFKAGVLKEGFSGFSSKLSKVYSITIFTVIFLRSKDPRNNTR